MSLLEPTIDRSTAIPLVATKLEPPPLPSSYAARGRVEAILASGAEEACQLTLVSGPPGYGKTMAVRGWLDRQDRPFAWLSLDGGDDDPVRLARYLIAALRRVRPRLGERTSTLFGTAGLAPLELVVGTLLDEIAASDEPFVLVLDDCHMLASAVGQELVGRLVAQSPPFVQVVLVTRQDPRLPLARMRAHGRLVEIRADQLRYTVTEAAGLLAALGVVLTAESVGRLVDRTEGWAAGLQLAALTLRGRPDADSLVADFGVAHRYVIDYLADEVLAQSPDDVRTFLERTSVAERVCAGLADALTCGSDGDRMLREVEGRNLFLVALGADRTWYRYHHLFADYLRSRLEDEERRELQLRAARWCDERGLTVEATRYALASGRWPEATPIVATGARVALEHGEPATVLRSTAALPGAALSASADLLASRAWAAYLTGQMPVAAAAAAELANLDDGRLEGPVAGRARGVRAWLAVLDRRPVEGERLARAALESLGDDPFFRGLVLLALSDATWDLGRVDENAAAVREALRLARERTPTLATYLTGFIHAIGCNEQGRRPEGERVSRDLLAASTDSLGRVAPAAGPVRVGLGMLAYEGNDLATAASELEAGFAMCRRLGIDFLLGGDSRRARAMTRLATGGAESAREAAEEGLRMASEALPGTRVPAAEAVDALVALQTGDRRRALQWAEGVLADPGRAEMSPPNVRLYRDLTLARVLLATGSASRAETIALEAERYAEWAGTVLGRIQALILAASAAEQAGRRAEARARLSDAVTLAAPGGYVRRFVEDAPPLAHLLPTVRIAAPAFVDAVIEAIDAEAVRVAPGRSTGGSAWSASDGALLELLTQRELDVLRLVARGRSNAGIGDALGVSPGTAKWHVANVLGKLGVSSRTHAAARARELGLV